MFIVLGFILVILALMAVNTVLAVADALCPVEANSPMRGPIIIIGIAAIPFLFYVATLAAYRAI